MASLQQRTEIRDGMRIEWDVPITMDDGLVLRADVFRPVTTGQYPVLLSYGPYAKGLAFQDGYPSAWQRMIAKHPDVTVRLDQPLPELGSGRPGKVGAVRLRLRARRLPRHRTLARIYRSFLAARNADFYKCIEWAGVQPWSNGKVGLNGISYYAINQWHVASLQPPHLAAMCIWEGAADWYRDMTHHGGILSTFWAQLVRHAGKDRAVRPRRKRPAQPGDGDLVCGDETMSDAELARNRSDFGDEISRIPSTTITTRRVRRTGTR